jgi:exosortase E/protease (VPEID-CTERM system)
LQLRWAALFVLAALEVTWGINSLTVPALTQSSGLAAKAVLNAAVLLKIGVAFLATFLLILSRRFAAVSKNLHDQLGYRWWPWLAAHVIALLAFVRVSWRVLGPASQVSNVSVSWLFGWLLAGGATLGFLLLAAAPVQAWRRSLSTEWLGFLAAMVAGTLAWLGGLLAQKVWLPLAEMTLWSTRILLSVIYADVVEDPARKIVGTPAFAVQIAPVCSGYEGIALVLVFAAIYLWLFRKTLRFPGALLLLPFGVVAIWVANVLRVTVLIMIGTSFSPDVAVQGFHSQAGWIGFALVALGIIALSHRLFMVIPREHGAISSDGDASVAPALLGPLLVLLATSMLIGALSTDFALLYPLGVIATGATIWRFRRHYRPIEWSAPWQAVGIGVGIFIIWLLLVAPDFERGEMVASHLFELPTGLVALWLVFRVVGSVVTVPIAEELAFRGYLLRKLVSRDFESVRPGHFSWFSFLTTSALFGLMHQHWLAGMLAGGGYAVALYQRGRLGDAIVAHATSNALIAVSALGFGRWDLWA